MQKHRHACIAEAAGEGEAHNMQNTYENNWTIYFIAHFFIILGVQVPPGGSWEQACKNGAKGYAFVSR